MASKTSVFLITLALLPSSTVALNQLLAARSRGLFSKASTPAAEPDQLTQLLDEVLDTSSSDGLEGLNFLQTSAEVKYEEENREAYHHGFERDVMGVKDVTPAVFAEVDAQVESQSAVEEALNAALDQVASNAVEEALNAALDEVATNTLEELVGNAGQETEELRQSDNLDEVLDADLGVADTAEDESKVSKRTLAVRKVEDLEEALSAALNQVADNAEAEEIKSQRRSLAVRRAENLEEALDAALDQVADHTDDSMKLLQTSAHVRKGTLLSRSSSLESTLDEVLDASGKDQVSEAGLKLVQKKTSHVACDEAGCFTVTKLHDEL